MISIEARPEVILQRQVQQTPPWHENGASIPACKAVSRIDLPERFTETRVVIPSRTMETSTSSAEAEDVVSIRSSLTGSEEAVKSSNFTAESGIPAPVRADLQSEIIDSGPHK